MKMRAEEIRKRFLDFFKERGHTIIPSASLITPDEKGVTNATLFNSAGMQPLVPYLLGKPHPLGKRLANAQKCLRTVDIEDIGDKTHATFFEMLGNWSLGDYFKDDAIKWSYEFLTSKEKGLGLDKSRLYVTVFEGDENAPKDLEAFEIWKKYIPEHRIYFMSVESNWWEAGENGPCGPDSEMFYDVTEKGLGDLDKAGFISADGRRDVVEVWNDVFMQYEKKAGKIVGRLPAPSVDTGAGLERLAMVMQGADNIYDTDLLKPIMDILTEVSPKGDLRAKRIVADHTRASVLLISEGLQPSNTDRGYILRRLIRRAVRFGKKLGLTEEHYLRLIGAVAEIYADSYSLIRENKRIVEEEFVGELKKFDVTLEKGLRELSGLAIPEIKTFKDGESPKKFVHVGSKGVGNKLFHVFSTYGYPLELSVEVLNELFLSEHGKPISLDIVDVWKREFAQEFEKHQELSRAGAEKKFKGGLSDASDEMVVRYHTATHLLHQALHDVLGEGVAQKGSNITSERLRFDFSHSRKMTDEEIRQAEDIVNGKIEEALPVKKIILPRTEAEKTGARHFFGEKYGDEVSIYFVGENIENAYSKEFCGGPHVSNTSELSGPQGAWKFKIAKEEAVSAGVRRIKAVLK